MPVVDRGRRPRAPAVGTPAATITSFANAFEPSSRAAAADGPKHGTPAAAQASASPATSGASGPDDDEVDPRRGGRARRAPSGRPDRRPPAPAASRAMPGLPGAHSSSGRCGERASARTIACSRPPAPTTRTRTSEAMKSSIGIAASDS